MRGRDWWEGWMDEREGGMVEREGLVRQTGAHSRRTVTLDAKYFWFSCKDRNCSKFSLNSVMYSVLGEPEVNWDTYKRIFLIMQNLLSSKRLLLIVNNWTLLTDFKVGYWFCEVTFDEKWLFSALRSFSNHRKHLCHPLRFYPKSFSSLAVDIVFFGGRGYLLSINDDMKVRVSIFFVPSDDGALSWEEFKTFFQDGISSDEELSELFKEIDTHHSKYSAYNYHISNIFMK